MAGFFRRMSQRLVEPDALPRPLPGVNALPATGSLEEHEIDAPGESGPRLNPQPGDRLEPRAAATSEGRARTKTIRTLREVRVEREIPHRSVTRSAEPDDERADPPAPESAHRATPQPVPPAGRPATSIQPAPPASVRAPAPESSFRRQESQPVEPARLVDDRARDTRSTASKSVAESPRRGNEGARPVKVSIGRIEIRTNLPQQPVAPPRNQDAPARVSLDDYLARSRR